MTGNFITFEGPEGSGKSTHARLLVSRLIAAGLQVTRIREPGGTRTGEAIRGILQHDSAGEPLCAEAEVLLFAASRAQLVQRVVLPALEAGNWVVSDRFADSTTVYQGYARGLGIERMLEINAFAVNGAAPNLTLLMDLPIEEGFRRVASRNERLGQDLDRFEREDMSFHERVRKGYHVLAEREPDRFRIIPVNDAVDAVAVRVWETVNDAFGQQMP